MTIEVTADELDMIIEALGALADRRGEFDLKEIGEAYRSLTRASEPMIKSMKRLEDRYEPVVKLRNKFFKMRLAE